MAGYAGKWLLPLWFAASERAPRLGAPLLNLPCPCPLLSCPVHACMQTYVDATGNQLTGTDAWRAAKGISGRARSRGGRGRAAARPRARGRAAATLRDE